MSIANGQRGASAVEFAFILPVMVLLLWGTISFGSVFFAQIALSGAAADGARAASARMDISDIDAVICRSLTASGITTTANCTNVSISSTEGSCPGGPCVRIRVEAPYQDLRGTPILPSISLPLLGTMQWLPDTLVAEASALR